MTFSEWPCKWPSVGDLADEGAVGNVEIRPAEGDDVISGMASLVFDLVQIVSGVNHAHILHRVGPGAADTHRQGPVPCTPCVYLQYKQYKYKNAFQ